MTTHGRPDPWAWRSVWSLVLSCPCSDGQQWEGVSSLSRNQAQGQDCFPPSLCGHQVWDFRGSGSQSSLTCSQSFGDLGSQESSGGDVRGWRAAFLQGGRPHAGSCRPRGDHTLHGCLQPGPRLPAALPNPPRFPCLPAQRIQG